MMALVKEAQVRLTPEARRVAEYFGFINSDEVVWTISQAGDDGDAQISALHRFAWWEDKRTAKRRAAVRRLNAEVQDRLAKLGYGTPDRMTRR
jgi:hypothetical protein